MESVIHALTEKFSISKISDYLVGLIPMLVVAAIILAVFYLGWRFLRIGLRVALSKTNVDRTAQSFLQIMLKYTLFVIALVSALGELGVNTGALLTSLGIAGLTIGFAAKDALSNIISGIFIFWDRPFVIGDLIEVGSNYGRVEKITLRSTRVVTVDGRMLAIPNTEVVNSTVSSYTNYPHLRLDVEVTVGVGEDLERARNILLNLVAKDDRFMDDPAPVVVVSALNDYNVRLVVQAWLKDETTHIPVRFELRKRIFEALRREGVDMPFQTIKLAPNDIQPGQAATSA
ncbi:MAG TPA: mechanosensitive ion channel family protein [Myxococcota bacterium]|nr:mechanosensitive ion channel family protein [Myxococcota bacterium]